LWTGGVLYFSDSHYFTLKENCGNGTNNTAKLMVLKIILKRAFDYGLRDFQVFGDSLPVVNWILDKQHINNLDLQNLALHLNEVISVFESFYISHIFMEFNQNVDALSKEGFKFDPWRSPFGGIF
jgi:ribonuclease HI